MAGCIFALIKGVNAFRRSEAIKLVVIDKPEIALLKEIRDLLSQRNPSGNEHAQAVRAEHGH
jgi:large-conductance mechanosensitive channel